MKSIRIGAVSLSLVLSAAAWGAAEGDPAPLPTIDGRVALATVNGVPISLDGFMAQLASLHQGQGEEARTHQDPSALLDRLITIELVVQEARNIGLDELPEVSKLLESYRMDLLREVLFARRTAAVTAPEDGARALYESRVREFKVRAILFSAEEDARAAAGRLQAGAAFDVLAGELAASGKNKVEELQLRPAALVPEAAAALEALSPGQASAPVGVGGQWAILKLIAIEVPDNPVARKKAEQDVLEASKASATRDYRDELRARHTTVDKALLDSIDFEAPDPGFEALKKDTRVVATVAGQPVTVGDLAARIGRKFFHGVSQAVGKGKVNASKEGTLEDLLTNRAILVEAERLKIAETPEFQNQYRDYQGGVLFGLFVKKVIDPEIKVTDAELTAYLEGHRAEAVMPEQMRLEAIGFRERPVAEGVLDRLRKGADLAWVRANSEGQITGNDVPQVMQFPRRLLPVELVPEPLRKALSGARAGEYRLAEWEGGYWILVVREVASPRPVTLEEGRGILTQRVTEEKRQAVLDDWSRKLRAASEVKVFATGERLTELLKQRFGPGA